MMRRGGRRSSGGAAAGTGRRCSLATFTATARGRSGSRGHAGLEAATEPELESCRPRLEEMPTVAGYEGATFEPTTVAPPDVSETGTAEEVQTIGDPIRAVPGAAVPDEGRLRALLRQYAAASCARDGAAASEMRVVAVQPRPVYKYSLETHSERRQVCWSFEPHTGGEAEPAAAWEAPAPWRVEAAAPAPFRSGALAVEVPGSGAVRTCASCGGVGSRRCGACAAAGWERCPLCLGDGHKSSLQGRRERCLACLGTGRKKCWKCCGDTIAACRGCAGTGQIRCFLVVNVNWTSHADSVVTEEHEDGGVIGKRLLERTSGFRVFEEESRTVAAVADGGLRRASTELLERHRAALASKERILRQRHRVEAVPVLRVDYEWRRRTRSFFVYGAEERVLAPDYPEAACCCALL